MPRGNKAFSERRFLFLLKTGREGEEKREQRRRGGKRNKIERNPENIGRGKTHREKEGGGEEKAQQQIRHFVNFIGLKGS
jgi:hypothetical protein